MSRSIMYMHTQYKMDRFHCQEGTGGQPPDPRSCGGLRAILKALHYQPVHIIHAMAIHTSDIASFAHTRSTAFLHTHITQHKSFAHAIALSDSND